MRVLLIGASGFLGRHAQVALRRAGHELRALQRRGGAGPCLDWTQAHRPAAWAEVLAGMDAAIYLPGTVRDREGRERGLLERLHHELPAALGRACIEQGVGRLLHVSALCGGESAYARSKHAGEAALQVLAPALNLQILRPSPVQRVGEIGAACGLERGAI